MLIGYIESGPNYDVTYQKVFCTLQIGYGSILYEADVTHN